MGDIATSTVNQLCEQKKAELLRADPEYQRGAVWSRVQKQMFVDSLMRGYSIPAFYFHIREIQVDGMVSPNVHKYIIDGQQRINAITEYIENSFPLLDPKEDGFRFPNFVKEAECEWAGQRYEELSSDLQQQLREQEVVVYEIITDNENEVRDLFIRLQAGTPLTPQDKRDAWPGNFTEFVLEAGGKADVPKWYGWDLFLSNKKGESPRRQLVAQCYMLYHNVVKNNQFCDLKSKDLDKFYHEHIDFDKRSIEAKEFKHVCDDLQQEFDGEPPLIAQHLMHLILLMTSLRKDFVSQSYREKLANALHIFKEKSTEAKNVDEENREHEHERYHFGYVKWAYTSADTHDSIRRRHVFFYEEMLGLLGAERKDPQRVFVESDREHIFYRDNKTCQYCRMKKELGLSPTYSHTVNWEDAEIHHVEPHREGGKTGS